MRVPLQSLTCNLTAYYHAMFKDVAWLYHRPSDMEKDLSRFSHELAVNGSRFATLDLPALGKHLDWCLDQGQYSASRLPYGSLCRGAKVPVLLRDLYLLVFDTEGKLRPMPSIDAITALRTLLVSAKKIRLDCPEKKVLAELENFERIEHETRLPTLFWGEDDLGVSDYSDTRRLHFADALRSDVHGHNHHDLFGDPCKATEQTSGDSHGGDVPVRALASTLQRVCDIVFSSLDSFDKELPDEKPKHGPGVTAENKKWDDKFQFRNWPAKLENMYPYDWYGSPNLGEHTRTFGALAPGLAEMPSRVIAVPKTQKAPRLIAAEPTAHQWIQQLVWNQLESRLKSSPLTASVHFRDQRQNQEFARKGSVSGAYATIDLSSASDRLSCWVVERAARSNPSLLLRLHACRTRWVTYRKGREQLFLKLNKFAPMGSACTFPVQTVVYACAAIASVLLAKGMAATEFAIRACSRQISVFGDDICVPTYASGGLVELLGYLGLRVNVDKTYSRGLFRESCGSEWWNGHDVSVPKLLNVPARSTLTTMSSHIGVRNNFYKRGYWATARWLDSWISGADKVPTALLGSECPGLLGVTRKGLPLRFSKRYHRFEEYGYHPVSRKKSVSRPGWSALMKWYNEEPLQEVQWTSELTLALASFWKLGWFPTHNKVDYSVVLRRGG